jgi:Mitochondrial carrier protein
VPTSCLGSAATWQTVHTNYGLQGLWRGTLAGQLLYVPYTVVQFVTLQQVNLAARRLQLTETRAAPLISYASGAVAGMAATCISYPFDLLRTTLAAQGEPKVGKTRLSSRTYRGRPYVEQASCDDDGGRSCQCVQTLLQ